MINKFFIFISTLMLLPFLTSCNKNIEDFRYSENVSFNSILSNGYYECLGINEVELDEGFIEKKEGGVIATRWREKQRNNIFLG